jgi:hypothetical protein
MKEILLAATTRAKKIAFLLISSFGIFFSNSAHAGAPAPASCNGSNYKDSAVANSGKAIKKFNGYDIWDSMLEINNGDGRQERFWLDRVNESDKYGRIRHTWATTACPGFAWVDHEDFESGLAKELVAARDTAGRLVVAHIATNGGFYWRRQISPGGIWSKWWYSDLQDGRTYKNFDNKDFSELSVERANGVTTDGLQFLVNKGGKEYAIRIYPTSDAYQPQTIVCPRNKQFIKLPTYFLNFGCPY